MEKPGVQDYANQLYTAGRLRWSDWMGEKTASLSQRQLYLLLWVFIAFMGSWSFFQLYKGITGSHTIIISSGRIQPIITEDRTAKDNPYIPGAEYLKVKEFYNYMDSLANTAAGRKVRDSILDARPGLLDSIASIEAYYKSKLNK